MTIVQAMKGLASYLNECFTTDKYGLQYKSTTTPNEFEINTPKIFVFTAPSSELIDGYPANCPCVVITLDGRNDSSYDVTVNLCISSASVSDQEMAHEISPNVYEVGQGDGYSTESDNDLIIESILFTDQVYNYIKLCKVFNISNITVEYPDVSLPDFPYSISAVGFQMTVNPAEIGQNAFNDFY